MNNKQMWTTSGPVNPPCIYSAEPYSKQLCRSKTIKSNSHARCKRGPFFADFL